MSYINNPGITKEDILKKSLAHWNVGKTQEWIHELGVQKLYGSGQGVERCLKK